MGLFFGRLIGFGRFPCSLLLCSCDSFFLFFPLLFSSFGVGSLHLCGGLRLLDRPSHDGGLWPLHCQPVCVGVEMKRWRHLERERQQLQQTHLCFSVQRSVGLLQPPTQSCRGTIDWSASKPWRHGRWRGVKKGGSEMQGVDGRVKWGGQRAVRAPAKMQPVLPLQSSCSYS